MQPRLVRSDGGQPTVLVPAGGPRMQTIGGRLPTGLRAPPSGSPQQAWRVRKPFPLAGLVNAHAILESGRGKESPEARRTNARGLAICRNALQLWTLARSIASRKSVDVNCQLLARSCFLITLTLPGTGSLVWVAKFYGVSQVSGFWMSVCIVPSLQDSLCICVLLMFVRLDTFKEKSIDGPC